MDTDFIVLKYIKKNLKINIHVFLMYYKTISKLTTFRKMKDK